MTYAVPLAPRTTGPSPLTPHCPWRRRLLHLCNGQRTVQDLATILYLPTQVVQKLVDRALQQGWLELPQAPATAAPQAPACHPPAPVPGTAGPVSDCYRALQGELSILLGVRGTELLGQAAQMIRTTPAHLSGKHVPDLLIALELSLPRDVADAFGPQFDALRDTYAG